jgi:hypothetical protein
VTEDAIAESVERARAKFARILAAIRVEREAWPKCPHFGQGVRPAADGGEGNGEAAVTEDGEHRS